MNGISSNRSNNVSNYYSQIANDWKNNPEVIPLKVREVLDNEQIGQLNASKVQEVLSNVKLTPHEGKDGRVHLIDSFIHNKISHYGGVAWAKAMDILEAMNSKSDELAHYPIKMITGTLLAEVA